MRAAKDLGMWHLQWTNAVALTTPEGEHVPTFEWITRVPQAPHRMGVVKAMVKSVKRALKARVAECRINTHDDWEMLACKATNLINSRPCDPTYWSDLAQVPITTNQVLFQYVGVRPIEQDLHVYWAEAKNAVEAFWKAWQIQAPPSQTPAQAALGSEAVDLETGRHRATAAAPKGGCPDAARFVAHSYDYVVPPRRRWSRAASVSPQ